MKFASRSGNRSSARQASFAAALVETCEARLLLTTPNILSPTGTVTADTVEVTWEAVDNAVSYEVWVTSLETYERVFYDPVVTETRLPIAAQDLSLGRIRIWARATLSDGTKSAWSPSSDALLRSTPQVTGPASMAPGHATDSSTPEITWTSANGASHFEIWVTDLEAKFNADQAAALATIATGETVTADPASYSTVYRVDNRQFDADGEVVTTSSGDPVLAEVRSFMIPKNPTDRNSEPLDLSLGRYRVWIRSFDPSFATTPGQSPTWGPGYTFQVSSRVQNVGPTGPTFQVSPNITWSAVEGATHYEVFVSQSGQSGPLFRRTVAATIGDIQSTQMVLAETGRPFVDNGDDVVDASETVLLERDGSAQLVQIPHTIQQNSLLEDVISTPAELATEYTVWVRAIRQVTDLPTVYGLWSAPARFRTVEPPRVTGPVGEAAANGRVVTSARPVVEWTAINGAARYEVLVHKFNSRPPFLEATSSDTTYTFTENVLPGTYTIWVRGIDTRGRYSAWSQPFQMVASGGAPTVVAPTAGQTVTFLTVNWSPVENAVSYQVWVAELGVDFEYVNQAGIVGTTFSLADPLNNGSYRVWVRALLTDGTFGPWSAPISFQGGIVQQEDSAPSETSPLLASLSLEGELSVQAVAVSQSQPAKSEADDFRPEEAVPAELLDIPHPEVTASAEASLNRMSASAGAEPEADDASDLLMQIAEQCIDSEWWEASHEKA